MTFLALQTQWKYHLPPMGGTLIWQGLDYTAAESVINLMGYRKDAADIFDGLRLMEAAALPLLREKT